MENTDKSIEVVRRWAVISGPKLTANEVLESVSAITGVDEIDIVGSRRWRAVVKARHLYWAMLRRLCLMSYPQIASETGHNHSSVIMAIRHIPEEVLVAMEELTVQHLQGDTSVVLKQTSSVE